MHENTYYIKIKKEYASAILNDLRQVEAIEIVQEPVPEWQKQKSIERLKEMKYNPSLEISDEDFFNSVDGEK